MADNNNVFSAPVIGGEVIVDPDAAQTWADAVDADIGDLDTDLTTLSTDFTVTQAEVVAARGESPDLNQRLFGMQGEINAAVAEVAVARGGLPNVNQRLAGMQSGINVVTAEVVSARGGQVSVNARLNINDTLVSTIDTEVLEARGSFSKVKWRFFDIESRFSPKEAEIEAARGTFASLNARFVGIGTDHAQLVAAHDVTRNEVKAARGGTKNLGTRINGIDDRLRKAEQMSDSAERAAGRASDSADQVVALDGKLSAFEADLTGRYNDAVAIVPHHFVREDGTPYTKADVEISDTTAGVVVRGAGQVRLRDMVAIEPGRRTEFRAGFARIADGTDPSDDAVRFGIQYYDRGRRPLGGAVSAQTWNAPKVTDGYIISSFIVSTGTPGDVTPPSGAAFMIPFLEQYGVDPEMVACILGVEDLTAALAPSDLTADALARIAALETGNDFIPEERPVGTDLDTLPNGAYVIDSPVNGPASASGAVQTVTTHVVNGEGVQRSSSAAAGARRVYSGGVWGAWEVTSGPLDIGEGFEWTGDDLSSILLGRAYPTDGITGDEITVEGTAWSLGHAVTVTTAINGLTPLTAYWIIQTGYETYKLAASLADAEAGTAITLAGSQQMTLRELVDPAEGIHKINPGDPCDGSLGAFVRRRHDEKAYPQWFAGREVSATEDATLFIQLARNYVDARYSNAQDGYTGRVSLAHRPWTINRSLNCCHSSRMGLMIGEGTIFVSGAGVVGIYMTGSIGTMCEDLIIEGDENDPPDAAMAYARSKGRDLTIASRHVHRNVQVRGTWAKGTVINFASEVFTSLICEYKNDKNGGHNVVITSDRAGLDAHAPITWRFAEQADVADGVLSTILHRFDAPRFLRGGGGPVTGPALTIIGSVKELDATGAYLLTHGSESILMDCTTGNPSNIRITGQSEAHAPRVVRTIVPTGTTAPVSGLDLKFLGQGQVHAECLIDNTGGGVLLLNEFKFAYRLLGNAPANRMFSDAPNVQIVGGRIFLPIEAAMNPVEDFAVFNAELHIRNASIKHESHGTRGQNGDLYLRDTTGATNRTALRLSGVMDSGGGDVVYDQVTVLLKPDPANPGHMTLYVPSQ